MNNIVFMGTAAFGLPTLNMLIKNFNVSAVFSNSPKPVGRKLRITKSPIHEFAESKNIPIYTPKTLKNESSLGLLTSIKPDILVVVAYGLIIPKSILDIFPCFNIHPSSLPYYRGAAPLQHVILNGEQTTSVCVIRMNEGVDTGPIVAQKTWNIDNTKITFSQLHDKSASVGADLLLNLLQNYDEIEYIEQDTLKVTSYANKFIKSDGKLNWKEDAFYLDCKIRALTLWPGCYFIYKSELIKVLEAKYVDLEHNFSAGDVMDDFLTIACGKGALQLLLLQREGKRPLKSAEFLRGFNIPKNVNLMETK